MSDATSQHATHASGGAFGKAFLPGLILGLVVGGFAGAVLPTIIAGGPKAPERPAGSASRTPGPDHDRQERPPLPPDVQQAVDEAEKAAEAATQEATDDAGQAVERVEDAVTNPPTP
jgi:hypothetical protein